MEKKWVKYTSESHAHALRDAINANFDEPMVMCHCLDDGHYVGVPHCCREFLTEAQEDRLVSASELQAAQAAHANARSGEFP